MKNYIKRDLKPPLILASTLVNSQGGKLPVVYIRNDMAD